MNNLNSVLIEGTVIYDCDYHNENKFTLVSYRYFKQGDIIEKESFYIDVLVNDKLATYCSEKREVRVVGKLKNVDDRVVIEAEHIEFKH
jgi:hypothetical protein